MAGKAAETTALVGVADVAAAAVTTEVTALESVCVVVTALKESAAARRCAAGSVCRNPTAYTPAIAAVLSATSRPVIRRATAVLPFPLMQRSNII